MVALGFQPSAILTSAKTLSELMSFALGSSALELETNMFYIAVR